MKTLFRLFTMAAVLNMSFQLYAADYGILLRTLSNPHWVEMKKGIEEEAQKLNVTVDIIDTVPASNAQAQARLFQKMNKKNYKAIGFIPVTPVNLIEPAVAAYANGTILVNMDEKIDVEMLKFAGANINAFISTDNLNVGANGASYIVDALGAEGGKVIIISGKAGNETGERRKRGAKKVFNKAENIELVVTRPANWERVRGFEVVSAILKNHPDIKGIYAANDLMAIGAQQAVAANNKQEEIIIVGTDGIIEAVNMIKNGKLAATVAQDPKKMGALALRNMVQAVAEGKQLSVEEKPEIIKIDSFMITP